MNRSDVRAVSCMHFRQGVGLWIIEHSHLASPTLHPGERLPVKQDTAQFGTLLDRACRGRSALRRVGLGALGRLSVGKGG